MKKILIITVIWLIEKKDYIENIKLQKEIENKKLLKKMKEKKAFTKRCYKQISRTNK